MLCKGIQIKSIHSSFNHIFDNESHIKKWFNQIFVTDKTYTVNVITYKKRRCCGEVYAVKVLKSLTIDEVRRQDLSNYF